MLRWRGRLFHLITLTVIATVVGLDARRVQAHSDDGVYTRTIEIEVRPADVPAWEAAVAAVAGAVREIESTKRTDWLVYRSGTTRYFVVVNRSVLEEAVNLASLYSVVDDAPEDSLLKSALTALTSTDFRVTADYLWHQHAALSTVQSMSTETNPLAVMTEYSIQPEGTADFEAAMLEYVSFLKRIEYRYPVEGFHWRLGRPGRFMSVVFPDTWVNFYGSAKLESLVENARLGSEFSRVSGRVREASQSMREVYLTFAPELSP